MSSRLALVNCKEATEGPWTNAKGDEARLEIFGLNRGESIRLELDTINGPEILSYYGPGSHPWPSIKSIRYRVCKDVTGDTVTPTTVRVLLINGKH